MNGVRSTFMRRGYLLTALSALLLLAASAGTASAQRNTLTISSNMEGQEPSVTLTLANVVDANTDFTLAVTAATDRPNTPINESNYAVDTGDVTLYRNTIRILKGSNTATVNQALALGSDVDAEDEYFTLTAEGTVGADTVTVPANLMIDDDEVQRYVLALDPLARGAIVEGAGSGTNITLTASPARTSAATTPPFTVVLEPNDPTRFAVDNLPASGTPVDVSSPTTGQADDTASAGTIEALVDKNRTDDTVVLKLYSGTVGNTNLEHELSITAVDIHQLPPPSSITAGATDNMTPGLGDTITSVEEGGKAYLWVTIENKNLTAPQVSRQSTAESFTVSVAPYDSAQALDYRVSPSSLKTAAAIALGSKTTVGPFALEVLDDEDVGMEALMLNLEVTGDAMYGPGTSTGSFSIDITDTTMKQVEPKPESEAYPAIEAAMAAAAGEEGLNPGESFMVMTSDLFMVADGYTASYGASIEGGAVTASASGDAITVTAVEAGEAKVTVTATASAASSSFNAEQSVANVATIMFPITVTDKMLTLTIEMPDNVMEGNVVEGMSYHVPVMTNRAVHEDTDVTFMRDRSQSDADEDDYSIGDVTIMAGEHMAMAELMVTEDMMDDAGHAMGEQLVIYAMAGDVESNELMFTIWDEAVPALPLIAQLLLALFLMAGGARLYRRRQS